MALFKGSLGLYGDNQRADVLLAQQLLMVASPYDEKDSAVERFWSTEPDGVAGDAFFAAIDYFCHEANADTLAGQNFYPTEPMHLLPGSYEETALQERAEMGKVSINNNANMAHFERVQEGLEDFLPKVRDAIEKTRNRTDASLTALQDIFNQSDERYSERVYINMQRAYDFLLKVKISDFEFLSDLEAQRFHLLPGALGSARKTLGIIRLVPTRIDLSMKSWGEQVFHEALHLFITSRFNDDARDPAYIGEADFYDLQPEVALANPDSYIQYILDVSG